MYVLALREVLRLLNRKWLPSCAKIGNSPLAFGTYVLVRSGPFPAYPAIVLNPRAAFLVVKDPDRRNSKYIERVEVEYPPATRETETRLVPKHFVTSLVPATAGLVWCEAANRYDGGLQAHLNIALAESCGWSSGDEQTVTVTVPATNVGLMAGAAPLRRNDPSLVPSPHVDINEPQ